jgi:hypothetical protein
MPNFVIVDQICCDLGMWIMGMAWGFIDDNDPMNMSRHKHKRPQFHKWKMIGVRVPTRLGMGSQF